MPRWVAAAGAGVFSAAVAGLLFWLVNNAYRVNGVGLLRRQEWPISSPGVWVAGGFAAGAVASFVRAARRARHARKTRELAEELGRGYAESYDLPPGAAALPVFEGWSGGRNAMTGPVGEVPVAVFDYTTVTRGSESDTVTEGTAALLPADGLPAFDLRPRTLGRRVLGWAGFEGLTFDPADAGPADAETVRRFAESFHLSTTDPAGLLKALAEGGAPSPPGADEGVRRLFTPAVMEVLNGVPRLRGPVAPRVSGRLAWVRRPAGPGADRAVGRRRGPAGPPEPSTAGRARAGARRAGRDGRRQAGPEAPQHPGGRGGGAVRGIHPGRDGPVRRVLPARPRAGARACLFALPLLFLGFVLAGAALGAGVGSRVPARGVPPGEAEDPGRRAGRLRATRRGVVVGLFVGFFGGFLVFAGSKVLFGWKLADFGVEGALFFGSIFGGALLGAVTCGAAANRLYRWREGTGP